ncbi:DUF2637 domain-containing protein [Streptomyces antibioticus]|uniref:DUF2637 domain-containing protein n=1 Tax=Streptomyces antibioticus TaxID=1890 RepID=UPI003D71C084
MTILAAIGAGILAVVGFAGSYSALQALGEARHWGWFSYAFPIGLDAGIVALYALDLHLARRGTPWPVLRFLAHTFTLATVWFNASAGDKPISADLVGAGMHAVTPVMFVAVVEAARRQAAHAVDLEEGRERPGVPVHRWFLAPGKTFAMWRRMRLWDVPSYREAVARERALTVYRVMLEREHGSPRKAPADARLPLQMAQYGLTVDEALALPQEAEEREQRRREAEADRKAAEEQRAEERKAATERARLRAAGSVAATQHEVAGETGQAQARAAAALSATERAARAEEEAEQTAAEAEARARAAAADRKAAADRETAAEAEERAAGIEAAAAEARARQAAAEADEEARKADAARARKATAEADQAAAEAAERAAGTRLRVAGIELRAVEAEDAAKLTPKERAVRRVARLILTEADGDAERLPLETVSEALGVSSSTASERRREAAELLATGYRPEGA